MLGFYYSTDKIIRIMIIVTVCVIHCWLYSSTNHYSALCHLHTAPAKCTQRHTTSATCVKYTQTDHNTVQWLHSRSRIYCTSVIFRI